MDAFELNFCEWRNWKESDWKQVEEMISSGSDDLIDDVWTDYSCCFDSSDDEQIDFLERAFKRDKGSDWIAFIIEFSFDDVVKSKLYEFPMVRDAVIQIANRYADDSDPWMCDATIHQPGIVCNEEHINYWSSLLIYHPELAGECKCYDKFSGRSICNLLAVHPEFADKFPLEMLADGKSRLWDYDDPEGEGWYEDEWNALVKRQPMFAKYC